MIQNIINAISDIQNNPEAAIIHMSSDRIITTVGNLQIVKLDCRWKDTTQNVYFSKLDPWDNKLNHLIPDNKNRKGYFEVIKYGLSGTNSLSSYEPLYKRNTPVEEQMTITMEKMKEHGARVCRNGLKITNISPLWNTVSSLATLCDDEFLNADKDTGLIWNEGVTASPNVIKYCNQIQKQLLQMAENNIIKRSKGKIK